MRSLVAAGAFAACVLAAGASHAQQPAPAAGASAPPTIDAVRQAARGDKRGLVEKNMQLTPEEAKKFWPIYDAYQKSLDDIVERQNRAVLDYVNTESKMTDANAKRIMREVVASEGDEQKLRERTMRKMIAALPAKKAVRFMQIENKLRAINRIDIAERIPLVR
jgi:Spy/CpxP family protein refolding chaperone